MPTPDFTTAFSRIEALALAFDNADERPMVGAARNLAKGAPAFWHKAGGNNAVVGGFMACVVEHGDVQKAWAAYEADFGQPCPMREPRWLDRLLPLNVGAIVSLQLAYEAIGTFRDGRELVDRTNRAEVDALAALGDLWKTAPHPLVVALGGLDHDHIARAESATHEAITASSAMSAVNLGEAMRGAA